MAERNSKPLFGFEPVVTTQVDKSQGLGLVRDISQSQGQVPKQPFDFLGIASGVSSLVLTPMAEEKNIADTHTARVESLQFVTGISQMSGSDKVRAIEDRLRVESDRSKFSEGYRKGSLSILEKSYASALGEAEDERVSSALQVTASNYIADMSSPDSIWGDNPTDYVNAVSNQYTLNPAHVRDAVMSSMFQHYGVLVEGTKNKEELGALLTEMKEKQKPFRNSLFLDSRSKRTASLVSSLQSNMNTAIASKQKEFKEDAREWLAQNVYGNTNTSSGYFSPATPSVVDKIQEAFDNPIEINNKINQINKGFEQANQARQFSSVFPIGGIRPALPEGNPLLKKERQDAVNIEANRLIQSNNLEGFIELVNNETGLTKGVGDTILNQFNNIKDLNTLNIHIRQMDTLNNLPKGATALRQLLGDGYADFTATSIIAKTLYNGNTLEARNAVDTSKKSTSFVTLDPQTTRKMREKAVKLGTLASDYLAVMNTITQINADVAKDKYKDIANTFSNMMDKQGGININNSMDVHSNSTKAIDPENFNLRVSTELNDNMDGELKEVVNIGKLTIGKDEFGTIQSVINNDVILTETNQQFITEKVEESKDVDVTQFGAATVGKALGVGAEVVLTQLPRATLELGKGVVQVFRRFGGFIGSQFNKDIENIANNVKKILPKADELMFMLDREIDLLTTELPDIPTNTLSEEDNNSLAASLEKNRDVKDKLQTLRGFLSGEVKQTEDVRQSFFDKQVEKLEKLKDLGFSEEEIKEASDDILSETRGR